MPAKPRKLLVTRRKLEFFVLRHRFGFDGFCRVCCEERKFVAVEEAMALSGTSMLSIFAEVTSGSLHHIESSDGMLMICSASIPSEGRTTVGKISA
jgi:hypothetical protein